MGVQLSIFMVHWKLCQPKPFTRTLMRQTDLRLAKEKTKRKAAIVMRQEEEMQQRDQALGSARRDLAALTQQLEMQRTELSGLQAENDSLRGKLEDSRQQLQSNEQMIRWLNQQVGCRGGCDAFMQTSKHTCSARGGERLSCHVCRHVW